jgi:hypothetical protein
LYAKSTPITPVFRLFFVVFWLDRFVCIVRFFI